jgi:hypothetical protein
MALESLSRLPQLDVSIHSLDLNFPPTTSDRTFGATRTESSGQLNRIVAHDRTVQSAERYARIE